MAIPFQKVILLPHYTTGFCLWQSPPAKKLRSQPQCFHFSVPTVVEKTQIVSYNKKKYTKTGELP
jgi:hypothetical protein